MKKFTIFLTILMVTAIAANAQWVQTNGTQGKKVTSFTMSGGNVFAGTYDGVLISTNQGSDWSATNGTFIVRAMTSSGNYIFAGNESTLLSVSSDNGDSWADANSGLTPGYPIVALTASGTNIYAGCEVGISLSTDYGANWAQINNGLTNTDVTAILAFTPYLSAGTDGGGAYGSNDNGGIWAENNVGLTNLYIRELIFTPTFTPFAATAGGVFMFNAGTYSWVETNNGITNQDVKSVIATTTDVYAGAAGGGLFKSSDMGANWTPVNEGLPTSDILSLAVVGEYLLAGTSADGVWKCALSGLTGIDGSIENNTITLYPNPASDYISLNLNSNKNTGIQVNIFNTMGSLVKNVFLEANQQKISTADLANGLYLIKIESSDLISIRSFIIQR